MAKQKSTLGPPIKSKCGRPKKASKEPTMPSKSLLLRYHETSSGGAICEGDEGQDWPSYEPVYIEVEFRSLHRSNPGNDYHLHAIDVLGDIYNYNQLILAVIFYTDGGTFGHTEGYWHVVGLYKTQKEADIALKEAKESAEYKPWEGYFSSFERADTYILPVVD